MPCSSTGKELVIAFLGQVDCGSDQAAARKEENDPADGAEDPGNIKAPAFEETVVIVEQVSLCERRVSEDGGKIGL
jgi:hypothetical protein